MSSDHDAYVLLVTFQFPSETFTQLAAFFVIINLQIKRDMLGLHPMLPHQAEIASHAAPKIPFFTGAHQCVVISVVSVAGKNTCSPTY